MIPIRQKKQQADMFDASAVLTLILVLLKTRHLLILNTMLNKNGIENMTFQCIDIQKNDYTMLSKLSQKPMDAFEYCIIDGLL